MEGWKANTRLAYLEIHEASRVLRADLSQLGDRGEQASEQLVVVGMVVADLEL